MIKLAALLLALLFAGMATPQPTGMIVDVGYRWPQRWPDARLAPGQITTLYVHGAGERLTEQVVSAYPFPFEVEGISVTLTDDIGRPHRAPILAMRPLAACAAEPVSGSTPCGKTMAAITIQVPYEMEVRWSKPPGLVSFIWVIDNGNAATSLFYGLLSRTVYIVRGGDAIATLTPESASLIGPLIRHSDGTLVSRDNPLQPGEIVTLVVTGLGYDHSRPDQRPKTGEPAADGVTIPIGNPYVLGIGIDFQFGTNPAADPQRLISLPTSGLLRAAAIPGQIGLYEVTLQVPSEIPRGTPGCGTDSVQPEGRVTIESNLRIVLGYGQWSPIYDSVATCVIVP